ncbi:MAG: GEVED domain-containing protein [Bacteroidales bacterium]|nr:GEVED domain-containing protein [Bacteroidales bacterium]
MKKFLRNILAFAIIVFFVFNAASQVPAPQQAITKTNATSEKTFFEIQQAFNDYWGPKNVVNGYYIENGEKKKAAGWKQFKRWEWYWETRVNPTTGEFPTIGSAEIYQQLKESNSTRNANGNWQSLGPSTSPGGYAGLGRINVVGFRPGDNNTLYAGSPTGGLWKTTDGGSNWSVLTDNNAVLGVSDVVIIAGGTTATDVVYIATGDRDGGSMWSLGGGQYPENGSVGVLKSIDGGTTWSATALTFTTSQKRKTNRLLKHPSNDNIIYATVSDGKVYQTTDGGITWPSIYTGVEFVSMEFKPGDPTIMYGSTRAGEIYRSVDSGINWNAVLTVGGASRVQLAVTDNDPTIVYAVVYASGLEGIYKSTDSGATYTKVFSGTNILGSSCDGSVSGGQGTYDLCIAADPNDANTVFVGGINTWKSTDGGSSWAINTIWSSGNYPGCLAVETHADKHFLGFQNGTSTLFEGNDGGVYKTTDYGINWSFISSGMVISQLYRLGVSQTSSTSVIAGLQDNGTKSKSGSTWTDVIGGDGMECTIDPTTSSTQYGEYQNGNIYRTTNSWTSSTSIISGLSGSRAWVTPFLLDPLVNTTMYVGCQDVWKSTNQGSAWTQISAWAGNTIRSLAVAPSNSSYIYAATQNILYATIDGGSNWTNITGTLPVGSSLITYISVKADDPLTAWVSLGEYNAYGVYETTDGGATWTNISAGLPSIPVMCVVQNKQNTTENELYAGTDLGIYVKVGSGGWTAFNTGLPNVVVTELEIYYNTGTPSLSRLRAATYGRGLWESELYSPAATPPVANFSADILYPGVGQTVTFTDLSTNGPASWAWSFTPSTVTYVGGTLSTSQNPQVQFNAVGDYTVQLTATNAYGSDPESKNNYISVGALQTYCAASGPIAISQNPYISGVQMGTINNTGTGSSGYINYTASSSTNVIISQSNSITITVAIIGQPSNVYYPDADIGIWIDWNQDGDFTDSGENVVCQIGMSSTQGIFSFSAPVDATLGQTTMRVRVKYFDVDCGLPCGTTTYGEVEDYKITVLPAENTWSGSSSTDWATAGNWSGGIVPTSSLNVTIPTSPAGGVFPVIGSGTTDAAVNNLTIESGASLSIAGNLTVNGTLTNNAGNAGLVIQSTSSSATGSLIAGTTGVAAKVQRYTTASAWHGISSPVSGADFNSLYLNGSPDVWAKSYNELDNSYSYASSLSTPLGDMKGWMLWIDGVAAQTFNIFGNLRGGTVGSVNNLTNQAGDATHGYNFVGNPFPSAIDWDAASGWTKTNISDGFWILDDANNLFATYNTGSGGLNGGSRYISSGQAFFVQVDAGQSLGTLTMTDAVQVHNGVGFLKEQNAISNFIKLKVSDDNSSDESIIRLDAEATEGFDSHLDMHKMFSFNEDSPQLFSTANDKMAINVLPLEIVSVPIDVIGKDGNEMNISIVESSDFANVYLSDDYLGIQTNLMESSYSFNYDASQTDRFTVYFTIVGVENNKLEDIKIYSYKKKVKVEIPLEMDGQIQIVNLMGQTVKEVNARSGSQEISIEKTGYFLVRIIGNAGSISRKVFIW